MGRSAGYPGGLLIRQIPENRRHRMARLRALALAAIATIAATGVLLQAFSDRRAEAGVDVARAEPAPFDYFPG